MTFHRLHQKFFKNSNLRVVDRTERGVRFHKLMYRFGYHYEGKEEGEEVVSDFLT